MIEAGGLGDLDASLLPVYDLDFRVLDWLTEAVSQARDFVVILVAALKTGAFSEDIIGLGE